LFLHPQNNDGNALSTNLVFTGYNGYYYGPIIGTKNTSNSSGYGRKDLVFLQHNSGVWPTDSTSHIEVMRITTNGNVGIGTIEPQYKLDVNGNVKATSFIGNLDGTYVNKLTGYAKASSSSAIATTDSLNTALGKLEYKADVTYDLVKGAYDGDGTIENLAEILKVLEGISDTETIQAIIGKYLPLTGGTLTGSLVIQDASFNVKSDTSTLRLLSFGSTNYIESGNAAFNDNAPLKITGYNGFTGSDLYL